MWCDEVIVLEPVESTWLSLRRLLLRALRGGQDLRAFVFIMIAVVLMVFYLPLGWQRTVYFLLTASVNVGKISSYLGLHYQEYGEKTT